MKKHSVTAKPTARERRKFRIRKHVMGTAARPRLTVFRSSKHLRMQLISDADNKTLVQASSTEADIAARIKKLDLAELKTADGQAVFHDTKAVSTKSVAAAFVVGQVIAERAKQQNVEGVVFDRNGFLYHGRIRAAAEGARAGGLKF